MSTTEQDKARDEAAQWYLRMTESPDSLSSAERDAFEAWIADPVHAQEFHGVANVVAITTDLPQAHRARLTEWARNYTHVHSPSRKFKSLWAVAAGILLAVFVGLFYAQQHQWFGESTYVTGTGEKKSVRFKDGSVAFLNTQTELRWIGTGDDRRVELVAGEALFEVTHDAAHPFRVMLDNSEIRVLGTRFNVYRKPTGETTVTTIEGTVEVRGYAKGSEQVWKREVHANEQIAYQPIGLVSEMHSEQVQEAVLWRSGIYQAHEKPIADVLYELGRYTDQHIVIKDTGIADAHVTGAFPTNDATVALEMLKTLAPIKWHEEKSGLIVESRGEAGER
jgi:transmembrane sensor